MANAFLYCVHFRQCLNPSTQTGQSFLIHYSLENKEYFVKHHRIIVIVEIIILV